MDEKLFSDLVNERDSDEFRDEIEFLIGVEKFSGQQLTTIISKMNFLEDFEELEYYGFEVLLELVKQENLSSRDIESISESVIRMDAESDQWSDSWLATFSVDDIETFKGAIKALEKKVESAEKREALSNVSKRLKDFKLPDPKEQLNLEMLLDVARSRKTPAPVLEKLATDPRVSIRLAVVQNPTTSPAVLKILLDDSNKEIALKAQSRLTQ